MPTDEETRNRLAQARARFESAFAGELGKANSAKWLTATQESAPNWADKFLDVFAAQLRAAEATQDLASFARLEGYAAQLRKEMTTARKPGAPKPTRPSA